LFDEDLSECGGLTPLLNRMACIKKRRQAVSPSKTALNPGFRTTGLSGTCVRLMPKMQQKMLKGKWNITTVIP
jgi:hypothetical protein